MAETEKSESKKQPSKTSTTKSIKETKASTSDSGKYSFDFNPSDYYNV